jgi:hypothetical protein
MVVKDGDSWGERNIFCGIEEKRRSVISDIGRIYECNSVCLKIEIWLFLVV